MPEFQKLNKDNHNKLILHPAKSVLVLFFMKHFKSMVKEVGIKHEESIPSFNRSLW